MLETVEEIYSKFDQVLTHVAIESFHVRKGWKTGFLDAFDLQCSAPAFSLTGGYPLFPEVVCQVSIWDSYLALVYTFFRFVCPEVVNAVLEEFKLKSRQKNPTTLQLIDRVMQSKKWQDDVTNIVFENLL